MLYQKYVAVTTSMLATLVLFNPVYAEEEIQQKETIEVIGITPTHGIGLPETRIPFNVQSATSADLEASQSLDITDFMNRNLGSVSVNDAQNNPLQKDVQYRGFTASPLLGQPQGIVVYQNSVRVNEVFGDTVNWDLIPESSIASMNLIGGANPLFGLNSLGGALSIITKNGFTHPGHSVEVYGGSHERIVTTTESGANNGTWGYYGTVSYFDEDGWRDQSPSDALNLFTSFGFRDGTTTSLDLNFNYADTDLIGNGAIPIELPEQDRDAIFTAPDQTENELFFIDLEGEHWFNSLTVMSGNLFYRDNDVNSFNGDGSEFEECDTSDEGELLVEGLDEDDIGEPGGPQCDGSETVADLESMFDAEFPEDQFGDFIPGEFGGEENNAINNISSQDQKNYGGSLQFSFLHDLFQRENQFILGGSYSQGFTFFDSAVEIAQLNDDRSTEGTGFFVPEEATVVKTQTRSWSVYLTDTIAVTDQLNLTLSGRYNNTGVKIRDESGDFPELTGEHDYHRFNPAAGITYAFQPNTHGYFNYSESARAPTPIELACADPDAPCNLPNSFLADPPLDQVVTKSFEGGFRGNFYNEYLQSVNWHVGGFHATNEDDIIFISTGGVSANEGFFDNVGDTQRLGMELGLNGIWNRLNWFLNYSFVQATFEDNFIVSSPNHPFAEDLGSGDDNEIQVSSGDRIPGIPAHSLKAGAEYFVTPKLSIGGDLLFSTGVYLRGDESNQLDTTDAYAVVNLTGNYNVTKNFSVFA
ncbi:MAG: TonB-dependent receptor, partial [Gammaproteobacteria bacterium]|nr:TonB-dependent receptor [Gammaproteobacteria bacterium]